jgi:hypothetical protein
MHSISTGSRKARRSVFGNEETLIKVDIGTIESLLPSDIARRVDLRTLYTLMPSNSRNKGIKACKWLQARHRLVAQVALRGR